MTYSKEEFLEEIKNSVEELQEEYERGFKEVYKRTFLYWPQSPHAPRIFYKETGDTEVLVHHKISKVAKEVYSGEAGEVSMTAEDQGKLFGSSLKCLENLKEESIDDPLVEKSYIQDAISGVYLLGKIDHELFEERIEELREVKSAYPIFIEEEFRQYGIEKSL